MKDSPLVLIMAVVAIACIVMAPRIRAAWPDGGINLPAPRSTPSAGDAAANATMVAQQQSAQMTASAAQSESQATAQAAVARATEQAMVADQAHQDWEAARQAGATAQAVQATAERERLVATATSAAETARAQATVVAATATRQVEESRMTATVESRHATATRQAIERIEKEKGRKSAGQIAVSMCYTAFFGMVAAALAAGVLLLLRQCLKHMKQWPSTLRALLFIWKRHAGRKKCKTKVTPS